MRRRRVLYVVAAVSAAGLAGVFAVAIHTTRGLSLDLSGFERVSGDAPIPFAAAGERTLRTIDVASVSVALLLLAFLGVVRGRTSRAVAGAAIVALSIGSTEVLKNVLLPFPPGRPATFPSGHTTTAVALGIAFVIAAPPVLRPTAALVGTAYGAAIAFSVVMLGWHFPSDAIGAFFVCSFWGALVGLALPGTPPRPAISARGIAVALIAVGAALLAAAAVASEHAAAVHTVQSRHVLVAAGASYAGLSLAVFAVLTPLLGERA
jgi:membrane-associated phospholipid phosphatase